MSGGTRSYEMARRFVRQGHEVHIITTDRKESSKKSVGTWRLEMIDGIYVHWLPVPYSNNLSYRERLKAFFSFAWRSGGQAWKIGGDIVLATSTPLTIAIPGIYASKRLKVPMVFEVRDLWPELPVAVGALKNPVLISAAKWLEKIAYRNSSHIVALSPGMASGIEAVGYPRDQISIVPNGADVDLFCQPQEKRDHFLAEHPYLATGPLVVYAGTLGIINGVGYFVDMAKEMLKVDPKVRFLVVGDGKERNCIHQKASSLGVLDNNFWMMPPVSKTEIVSVLSAATTATSFFVDLPEMWNNSANKFFDALAAGKPLMINYKGWQAEILEESGAGIVVPPNDAATAAKILHQFLGNRQRIEEAKNKAKHLAQTAFNRNVLAEKMLNILEEAKLK